MARICNKWINRSYENFKVFVLTHHTCYMLHYILTIKLWQAAMAPQPYTTLQQLYSTAKHCLKQCLHPHFAGTSISGYAPLSYSDEMQSIQTIIIISCNIVQYLQPFIINHLNIVWVFGTFGCHSIW